MPAKTEKQRRYMARQYSLPEDEREVKMPRDKIRDFMFKPRKRTKRRKSKSGTY